MARTFRDEYHRQAFLDSGQYKEVNALLVSLMKKFGVVAGSKPTQKSGKFLVRVPRSVHERLEIEAKWEGVSLNQLAVSKLTLPLRNLAGIAAEAVIEAFNAVHDGHSQDWCIVDGGHNVQFIEQCRRLGLTQPEKVLNHSLFNIRKNPKYKGLLNKSTKRSGFDNYDDCFFAAEIAVRTVQRFDGVTLDRILCDPEFRKKFDDIAMSLSPTKDRVKLRCAALNLRKTHRLKPLSKGSDGYDLVTFGHVIPSAVADIAASAAMYVFYNESRPIYAGETENLRSRVQLHLNVGFPDWTGVSEPGELILKSHVVPGSGRDDRLKWLGDFINSERPLLNYQKAA